MSSKFLTLTPWAKHFSTTSRLLKHDLGRPVNGSQKTLAKRDWSVPTKRTAPKRDWSKPVDRHAEKYPEESAKTHEHHINKFSKPPPKKSETVAQRKERKKREEELELMAREEAKQKKYIADRKAKQKAREAKDKQMKDVYIPEIINVANLSRILGIRLGK
ncbi:hypothetical protein G6F56_011903 [Rhizopus delemar]|nr:hypothetical protein G6F56_011903 [Rhizopus delemar]